MIRYHDFVPQQVTPAGFLTPAQYDSLHRALVEANQWIKENEIRVLNVDTVVLPNIWSRYEEGSRDPALGISGDSPSHWHQFVRVWYQVG